MAVTMLRPIRRACRRPRFRKIPSWETRNRQCQIPRGDRRLRCSRPRNRLETIPCRQRHSPPHRTVPMDLRGRHRNIRSLRVLPLPNGGQPMGALPPGPRELQLLRPSSGRFVQCSSKSELLWLALPLWGPSTLCPGALQAYLREPIRLPQRVPEGSTMSTPKPERHGPMLISFSGLDGSGKTTQIENLRNWLWSCGLRVRVLAFWDDVVVAKRYREGFVHKVYKSEQGIGAPGKPVNRRDKNVRAWYLSIIRHALYLLDAINLFQVITRTALTEVDVIIMDRYIYDELANLPLNNPLTRLFVRLINASVPNPDISYFLDRSEEAAY